MLQELLKVKHIREQSAREAVTCSQKHLQTSRQQLRDRQQALKDYVLWRGKEEQLLYDNIMNSSIRQHDLDVLKQKVALLRERDAVLEQAVEKAKNAVIEAEEQLEQARQAHHKTLRAVEKFEEYRQVLEEQDAREAQRIEDSEMDEFSIRSNRQ